MRVEIVAYLTAPPHIHAKFSCFTESRYHHCIICVVILSIFFFVWERIDDVSFVFYDLNS